MRKDGTSEKTHAQNWGSAPISCRPIRLFLSCDHVNFAYCVSLNNGRRKNDGGEYASNKK